MSGEMGTGSPPGQALVKIRPVWRRARAALILDVKGPVHGSTPPHHVSSSLFGPGLAMFLGGVAGVTVTSSMPVSVSSTASV